MATKVETLENELNTILRNQESYHNDMDDYLSYYNFSAFYRVEGGSIKQTEKLNVNLLKTFADKNIHYTSKVPNVKVVPIGAYDREFADLREKLIYATYAENMVALKQRGWARDATKQSFGAAEIEFDFKKRRVVINRLRPRYVFWLTAKTGDRQVKKVWLVEPILKSAAKQEYGVEVGDGGLDIGQFDELWTEYIDEDYVLDVRCYDSKNKVHWCGNKLIRKTQPHGLDQIPVEICIPFETDESNSVGDFFLRPLVPLQAELNDAWRKKANIVRKLGNPAVWGRGIIKQQFEDVKSALMGEGGFIGLKGQGELGMLTPPETAMIDNHINGLIDSMMKISGFGAASFGESVGANTSGDALSMYFTPTTRKVEDQQIAWEAFYRGINAKILRLYERWLKTGETITIQGVLPSGTFMGTKNIGETKRNSNQQTSFMAEIDKTVINGNYQTEVIFASPTPKDEVAYKRLLIDAVDRGVLSRDTALEEWGIQSPSDEVEKLRNEQSDPALNPDGTSKLLAGASKFDGAQQPALEEQPTDVGFNP